MRDELTRRAGGYVRADVDAWLAHAALLAELVRLVPGVDTDQLAFAARLATTEPEAAGDLAALLARARSGAS
ncbi:hypothetical protein [Streptomyces virginiae]|uniref:hypothetical protein n=1 Tax=Streptomyces virginiae TaxID=1961 RepID=UPI003698EEEA